MDQEAAMERDPDNFDPSQDARGKPPTSSISSSVLRWIADYDAIDLPTFTVSSRDYIRITGQVQNDGEPTCFTDKDDTQIPQLQDWCRSLTVSSRERAARTFLNHLKTFSASVEAYLIDISK
jgi:hypothetical protein